MSTRPLKTKTLVLDKCGDSCADVLFLLFVSYRQFVFQPIFRRTRVWRVRFTRSLRTVRHADG